MMRGSNEKNEFERELGIIQKKLEKVINTKAAR
jgi:hypothetical protein